ncbi:MAG: response regulator [Anaerolineales bacterium]|nr:response regulator [Anaerolineales bacterium]
MIIKGRILVVEDNEDNLSLLRLLLEREKYQVLTAQDGVAGLQLARQEQPDMILLDLAMPEMDGWELAQTLKADITTRRIPIIAVSAHALPKDRDRALASGCDGFIVKPFSIANLTAEIKRLI